MSKDAERTRKYGDKPSRPIYVWNGILEAKHRKRIGPAIWLFLYFIDRTTKERPNQHKPDEIQGWVYGKMPLTLARMSRETGIPERTISDYLLRLEGYDYIRTVRAPHGLIILVQKSCKWLKGKKKSAKTCESPYTGTCESPAKSCESPAKTCECRKDKAVDFTGDEAIRGGSTAHSAVALPLSRLNSENQSQPQEKPETVPIGKSQNPRPYTEPVLRGGRKSGLWASAEERQAAYRALEEDLKARKAATA